MRYPGSTVAESAHHQAGARRAAGWAGQEVNVNERRARELVAGERSRVEAALAGLNSEIHDEESITVALAADLREQLIAVGRAEERIALGTYGRSVDSGASIPDDRLEAEPLAERTVEEQRLYEQRGPK